MGIPAERLREGQQILVRGKISFSRLASLVEGPALQRSIDQAKARGVLYPTTKPHTTINLVDAQLVPANPAALTTEEQYVQEKIYVLKSGDNQGKAGFGIDNVSQYLPTILEPDPAAPGTYRQLVLDRDLASGLDVTIVIQVFKPQGYEKRGLGIQQIVLHEAPRYFSSGVDQQALAARGIVVNGPIRSVAAAEAPVDAAVAAEQFAAEASLSGFIPANTAVDPNGFAVPTPGAQGVVPAPAAPAFPLSTPVAQAPVAPVIETPEQQIARLQAAIAERDRAAAASGGGSPFDVAPATTGQPGPWDVPGQGPAVYQG